MALIRLHAGLAGASLGRRLACGAERTGVLKRSRAVLRRAMRVRWTDSGLGQEHPMCPFDLPGVLLPKAPTEAGQNLIHRALRNPRGERPGEECSGVRQIVALVGLGAWTA